MAHCHIKKKKNQISMRDVKMMPDFPMNCIHPGSVFTAIALSVKYTSISLQSSTNTSYIWCDISAESTGSPNLFCRCLVFLSIQDSEVFPSCSARWCVSRERVIATGAVLEVGTLLWMYSTRQAKTQKALVSAVSS